ncbi:hypothetical protein DYI41_20665 [Marinobacter salarius]|uniref:hypothetical protein n=1 Tax=Marinobacter salarius TaxID=1420917 RepID=UPI001BCB391B|nr:hypothetical protein [Marinobacter salarius]MBS8233324.1 hypothetical protein [Marinobacter salarius]
MKLKVCLTIFVFFLFMNLVESVLETGRGALQEMMEKEIRVSVLGPEPWDLATWESMSKEQLSNLMKNDDFLKKFSSAKQEAQDKYQWYFIAISVVQVLLMLLLALGCSKLVIGIVRRNEQP